uniref:Uncharacterized protein n=1 Tax=Ananas comosus var. bracteatus TaxID=296719 RepID=A0A6V7NWK6_ANACO|nr:unnamed protein product [Ananas comosus var. bracteatus]
MTRERAECWLKWASILPCGGRPCGPSHVRNSVRLGWAESCSKWREARWAESQSRPRQRSDKWYQSQRSRVRFLHAANVCRCWRGDCWLKWASILPCGGRLCGPSHVRNGVRLGWAESCSKWREVRWAESQSRPVGAVSPGQLYFVLPLALRDHALSGLDMAALAVKASAALDTNAAPSNKKIGRRVMSVEDALQHPLYRLRL